MVSAAMSDISTTLFFQIFNGGPWPHHVFGSFVTPLELGAMLSLIKAFRLKRIVEFGVGRGANARLFLDQCSWIKTYIGVDVFPGTRTSLPQQQHEVPDKAGDLVNDERFSLIIRRRGTLDISASDLGDNDFVFIDGDHSLAAVKHDTALARRIVKRGVICWHDYGHNPPLGPSSVIDRINRKEGDHICRLGDSWLCFEIR
jgi:predicted O-methyltransferase YrrM